MSWIEGRIQALEDRFRVLYRWLLDLQQQLRAVQQGLISAAQQSGAQPTSSGGGGYYGAILSGALAAGSGGALASIAGQTVWQVTSGARSNLSGTFTVYNDTGSAIAANAQVILGSNPDGTYTVVAVACTANP